MSMLSWIHLSDWHQKGGSFDRRVVRDALIEDIRRRSHISEELRKLDFAIFSGDLTFCGADSEYKTAREWFIDPVLKECGLTHDQFLIVPGNHDVDRSLANGLRTALTTFSERETLATVFANADSRAQILSPLNAYSRFVTSLDRTSAPIATYGGRYTTTLQDGTRVAFLCLNSAWLCGRTRDADGNVDDYGQLIVGEPQIEEALTNLEPCDLIVGILHHPFQWLALKNGVDDRIKTRARLMSVCDLILHGHEHEPATYSMQGTFGNCLLIPAGSTFERRDANSQLYANGYNYCRLDLSQRKCKVYFRRFDGDNKWLPDLQTVGGQSGGSVELQMPDGPQKPHHVEQSLSPWLPEPTHHSKLFDQPHFIDKAEPESVGTLNATVLERRKGGFETCLYVNSGGTGIVGSSITARLRPRSFSV
jgi:3',5'-cyclic AMP phosphodiesterase CpdA